MKKISALHILALSVFVMPFMFLGACNTDDVVIDGTGIHADSTEVYIDSLGRQNYFYVSTLYPWEVEFMYEEDTSWLTVEQVNSERSSRVNVTATKNEYRRRNTFLVVWNGYRRDTVNIIQKASPHYEPGPVILMENFALAPVNAPTAVSNYTAWAKTGVGSSNVGYSGSSAVIQADYTSNISTTSRQVPAYPDASMTNNVRLGAGGNFYISRININNYERYILTLYVASPGGNSSNPSDMLSLKGGTKEDALMDIQFEVIGLSEDHGWHKVVAEFRKVENAGTFYIDLTNTGSQDLYIDDILLEAAGKSDVYIGTPVPNVTTLNATDTTATSITLKGKYTLPKQITSISSAGFQFRLHADTEYEQEEVLSTTVDVEFSLALTGLVRDGTYVYRAYVEVDGEYTFGNDITVTLADPGEEGEEDD